MTIEEMKRRKRELGYTNLRLAEESGVPLGTLQKIFGGGTKAPRRETIEALERVLGRRDCSYTMARTEGIIQAEGSGTARTGVRYDVSSAKKTEYPTSGGMLREAVPAYQLRTKRQGEYTKEDYYSLPDEERVELIDGVFYDMASPTRIHQGILGGMYVQLDECIQKQAGTCFLYMSPSDVELSDRTVVQPDIYIHCHPENEYPEPLRAAPDFVVEIVSPSNPGHDIWRKQELYRNHGVREYWVVDPRRKLVTVFPFEKEELPKTYEFEDVIPIGISNGECEVDFRKVFRRVAHFYAEKP